MTPPILSWRAATALASAAAALLISPPQAFACGGLFCNAAPTEAPLPVDQSGERVLFEVDEERTTAHVHIAYAGEPDAFAWVVPVAGVPTVEDSSVELLDAYDQATATTATLPPGLGCSPGGGGVSIGCAGVAEASSALADTTGGGAQVLDHDFTDTYEYHIVGASDSEELFEWLEDNNYNVSENMRPVMDEYLSGGTHFLALKLNAGAGAREVKPVAIGFAPGDPMIPLRLTAVAAQPLMGVQVMIVSDKPYVPVNYTVIERDAAEMVAGFDADGNPILSYHAWVARAAAENNGRLFVREFAGLVTPPAVEGRDPEAPVYVSRYYTRLSPQHMTTDPMFAPAPADADVDTDATLDLSDQAPLTDCGLIEQNQPSPCAFNFCGVGATCLADEGEVMCACQPGDVAQRFQGPQGWEVTCVPAVNPYGITDQAAGAGTEFDPCAQAECGDGTCVLRGGFPTCLCDSNRVARLGFDGALTCQALPPAAISAGPGAGVESHPTHVTLGGMMPSLRWLLFGLALMMVYSRRRGLYPPASGASR